MPQPLRVAAGRPQHPLGQPACRLELTVGPKASPSGSPTSYSSSLPDAKPNYPPNTGTLIRSANSVGFTMS